MKYCLITDRKLYKQDLLGVASEAESAGVDYFQLREKDLGARELLSLARSIRPLLKQTGLIVNGSLEVALASGANGVHLQRENVPVEAVRPRYPDFIIGYSAHTLEEMKTAQKNGASYVFLSPVFETRSKVSMHSPLGASCAARWSRSVEIPVFALGGVAPENINELKSSGIGAIAGISFFIRDGKFTSAGMVV